MLKNRGLILSFFVRLITKCSLKALEMVQCYNFISFHCVVALRKRYCCTLASSSIKHLDHVTKVFISRQFTGNT